MYLIKLKIEMNMADLIIKIVRASVPPQGHELHRYAASGLGQAPQSPRPRASLPAGESRDISDASTTTRKYTSAGSQTNIVPLPEADAKQQQCSPKSQPLQQTRDSGDQGGWELTRMPRSFDVGDVVRKGSVTDGSCVGLMPFARPPLMRNMSETTELEIEAGYLDRDVRDRRTSGPVNQSPD